MRKIISMAAALMLAGSTAFAAPSVITKDASQNIINISGKANKGELVSVLVVNSGYTTDDVHTNSAQATQYVRSAYATKDSYSFDITMNVPSDGGGDYIAVVNVGGTTEKTDFTFYPVGAKNAIVELLNAAATIADLTGIAQGSSESLLERTIEVFDLKRFYLTKDASANDLAEILLSEFSDDINDLDPALDAIKASIYVSALNNSSSAAFDGGYLTNAQILGIENTNAYKSYASDLNETGVSNVRSAICGKDFASVDAFVSSFKKSTILQLIVNNKKYGSGHVESVLTTYAQDIADAGFNSSKLSQINNKTKFFDKLITSNATTLEALAYEFNNYKESDNQQSGGPSVGGSSSAVGSTPSIVPEYIPSVSGVAFDDIASVDWAKEAIDALSQKGIVNGKGNGKFDPNGIVTRAEFTKMIIGAANLLDQSADCSFNDVADDWSKPYIASAVKHGIVNGMSEADFGSFSSISREQAAVIVYRTLKNLGIDLSGEAASFADEAQSADYAKEAIAALSGAKIINGKGNNMFAPTDSLTRAEAAKIIYTSLIDNFTNE